MIAAIVKHYECLCVMGAIQLRSYFMSYLCNGHFKDASQFQQHMPSVPPLTSKGSCPRNKEIQKAIFRIHFSYHTLFMPFSSRSDKAGHPQWFVLGVGQVIKGLDLGMNDMCPGEKRKITVPPSLGFGKEGKGKQLVIPLIKK